MVVETERLLLIPLTSEQLRLWICDLAALERTLSCTYRGMPLDTAFTEDGFSFTLGDLVQAQAERCVNAYPFGTYWWLVRKIDLTAVGTIDFKTAPNEAGQVEIGYGLSPAFEHRGYMTEAVRVLTEWTLKQPGAATVVSLVETDNRPSRSVMSRAGFRETCTEDGFFRYEFTRNL